MKLKKALSLLLSALLAFAVALPAAVSAAPTPPDTLQLFTGNLARADALIYEALKNRAQTLDLSGLGLYAEDVGNGASFSEFMDAVKEAHPDMFMLSGFGYTYLVNSREVIEIDFEYYEDYTEEDIAATQAVIDEAVYRADALELGELDRVLFGVDFLKERSVRGASEEGKNGTAYDAIMTEQGSMYAYVRALTWVLRALGLEAYYVDGGNHTCPVTIVSVNGKWYFVDPEHIGYVNRSTLISEEKLDAMRTDIDETNALMACGWKSVRGLCDDTVYDEAWWNTRDGMWVRHEMGYLNGIWYLTDGCNLYAASSADPTAVEKLTDHTISERSFQWFRSGSSAQQCCDVLVVGGNVFFSMKDGIVRYDPETRTETVIFNLPENMMEDYGEIVDLEFSGSDIVYKLAGSIDALWHYAGNINYVGTTPYTCAHLYGAWTETDPGTCVSFATERSACVWCGEAETRTTDRKGPHQFGAWAPKTAATCMTEGTEERACALCPETESRSVGYGAHNYGPWTVATAATCGAAGEERSVCQTPGCGDTRTRPIPATGAHTDADGDALCDDCGADLSQPEPANPFAWLTELFAKIRAFFEKIAEFFRRLFQPK